jgi:hypothetical protein
VYLAEAFGQEVVDRAAEEIAPVVAEHLLHLAVHEEDLTGVVGEEDPVGGRVDETPDRAVGQPDVGQGPERFTAHAGRREMDLGVLGGHRPSRSAGPRPDRVRPVHSRW